MPDSSTQVDYKIIKRFHGFQFFSEISSFFSEIFYIKPSAFYRIYGSPVPADVRAWTYALSEAVTKLFNKTFIENVCIGFSLVQNEKQLGSGSVLGCSKRLHTLVKYVRISKSLRSSPKNILHPVVNLSSRSRQSFAELC